ncbi:bi-functional transferase/deacetylase, partial [Streptomyces sp. NPDC047009]
GPLWSLPLQQFVYRQLMYLVVIQSVFTAVSGSRLRWQRMERYGSLQAPGGEAGTPHLEPIPQDPGLRPPVAYDAFQQPTPYDGHPQSPPPNGLPQPAPHETPQPY